MPVLMVRDLPDDVHRGLAVRAARRGRSMEEEWAVFVSRDKVPGRPVSLE